MEERAGSEHSPLPWMRGIDLGAGAPVPNFVVDATALCIFDREGFCTFTNAEFICLAVNHHHELVAALATYGAHGAHCRALRLKFRRDPLVGDVIDGHDGPCDCGFAAVLGALARGLSTSIGEAPVGDAVRLSPERKPEERSK